MANRRRARIGRMKANSTSAVPSSPASLGRRRISESLGDGRQRTREVPADSRQDRDRDQSDEQQDERVLDQRLAFVVPGRSPEFLNASEQRSSSCSGPPGAAS